MKSGFPISTFLPSTVPLTPPPVWEVKSSVSARSRFCSLACFTMARASGCSLLISSDAAAASSSSSAIPSATARSVTLGCPAVSVPVLSVMRTSTFSIRSSASAFLIRMPAWAARPTPTMIDIGVASPSAQGQAMIRTETAFTMAKAIAGVGPQIAQSTKVIAAITMTAGTNHPATVSANF